MFDVEKLNTAFKKQVDQAKLFAGPVVYSDDGMLLRPGNDPFSLNLTGVYLVEPEKRRKSSVGGGYRSTERR